MVFVQNGMMQKSWKEFRFFINCDEKLHRKKYPTDCLLVQTLHTTKRKKIKKHFVHLQGSASVENKGVLLPLCGKKIVNTQYRRVWGRFGILQIHMFPTMYVRNVKQCSGASKRENSEPPTNNRWILRKNCEVLFCHIKRLCLK